MLLKIFQLKKYCNFFKNISHYYHHLSIIIFHYLNCQFILMPINICPNMKNILSLYFKNLLILHESIFNIPSTKTYYYAPKIINNNFLKHLALFWFINFIFLNFT